MTQLHDYERDSIVDVLRELRSALRSLDGLDQDLADITREALELLGVEDADEN